MAISPLDDEVDVLTQVALGDERAFARLFMWYSGPLASFVQRMTNAVDVTEEIIQDVFVLIWQRRNTLTGIKNFDDYLFVVTRNQTYATLKKLAAVRVKQLAIEKQQLVEAEWAALEDPTDSLRQQIEIVVDRLPLQQRRAYSLSRYERLKHEEIAERMGISSETVKKHIQAAVKSIRQQLANPDNIGMVTILTGAIILS